MTKKFTDNIPERPDGLRTALIERSRDRRRLMRGLATQQDQPATARNDLLPGLTLSYRPIANLRIAMRRLRKDDPLQIDRIRASIETYGVAAPVLITETGEIIDGHLVIAAAKSLGLQALPCIVIDHLSPADIRRLRISLNRLAETGAWDFPSLRIEIQELADHSDASFEIPGLEPAEIDLILQDQDSDTVQSAADDAVPSVRQDAVSAPGDVWILDRHRLGCGDAKDPDFVCRLAAPESVRLCLTDPPYGVPIVGHVTGGQHREFVEGGGDMSKADLHALFRRSLGIAADLLVEGGICMPFIDWRSVATMLAAGADAGFSLLNFIVWAKTNAGMGSLYRSHHELLPVFKKGSAPHVNNVCLGRHGRYRSNVWTYPGASSLGSDARDGLRVHPTVKPVAMLEDAILDVTNRGDLVFDPFSGSGSTLIAAHRAGRDFCGGELDPLYVDVILRRWIDLTGEQPILERTGQSFEAIARRDGNQQP